MDGRDGSHENEGNMIVRRGRADRRVPVLKRTRGGNVKHVPCMRCEWTEWAGKDGNGGRLGKRAGQWRHTTRMSRALDTRSDDTELQLACFVPARRADGPASNCRQLKLQQVRVGLSCIGRGLLP